MADGGSRFLKEPFDYHDQRFAAVERVMGLQFQQVERRLERIEAMIEGLERRLWMKFANFLNFRGFPHIPGEDWLMASPSAAPERMRGGNVLSVLTGEA